MQKQLRIYLLSCFSLLLSTFQLSAQSNCPVNAALGINLVPDGDFGSGSDNILPDDPQLSPSYPYSSMGTPNLGTYTVTNNTTPWDGVAENWIDIRDNSPDSNGYMLVLDAAVEPGIFYQKTIPVCPETNYSFSIDLINIVEPLSSPLILPNIHFLLDSVVIDSTGEIPQDATWRTYEASFQTGPNQTSLAIALESRSSGDAGNDFAIDNIRVIPCRESIELFLLEECAVDSAEFGALIGFSNEDASMRFQYSIDGGATWQNTSNIYNLRELGNGTIWVATFADTTQYRLQIAPDAPSLDDPACSFYSNVVEAYRAMSLYIQQQICMGDTFAVAGQSFSESGNYQFYANQDSDCNLFVELDLTVLPGLFIDLDGDNSAGRNDVDWANSLSCEFVSPIADADLLLRICDTSIDSIRFVFANGITSDRLEIPLPFPQGIEQNYEVEDSTSFTIGELASLEEIKDWILSMLFYYVPQAGEDEAERNIGIHLFSGNEEAVAISYLTFRQTSSLGNDTIIDYCIRGESIDLKQFLPAGTRVNGTWINDTQSGNGVFMDTVDTPGIYSYRFGNNACRDTINFDLRTIPNIFGLFGDSLQTCQNQSIELTQPMLVDSILWPDGSRDEIFTIREEGLYTINYYLGSCEYNEDIWIDFADFIDIQIDTSICPNESFEIDLSDQINGFSLIWDDGNDSPAILIDAIGSFTAALNDTLSGCEGQLQLNVRQDDSCMQLSCTVFLPNSITPNGDGINDQWIPFGNCIANPSVQIFNRWGGLVYSGTGNNVVWYPDKEQLGVYLYTFEYTDAETGEMMRKNGSITLIK